MTHYIRNGVRMLGLGTVKSVGFLVALKEDLCTYITSLNGLLHRD